MLFLTLANRSRFFVDVYQGGAKKIYTTTNQTCDAEEPQQ
jgi:hypothetical protein